MHQLGSAAHLFFDFGRRRFLHHEAKADVFADRHVRENRVVLKHHGNAALARRQRVNAALANPDFAFGRFFQAGNDAHQRRLAATRGTEQYTKFAVQHLQLNRLERLVPLEILAH